MRSPWLPAKVMVLAPSLTPPDVASKKPVAAFGCGWLWAALMVTAPPAFRNVPPTTVVVTYGVASDSAL